MHFERLTAVDNEIYLKAMELYKISFPYHEQRTAASQTQIMENREYQFNLIYDEGDFVGILLCWETGSFIYIEHFCIDPDKRNRQYGQRALALLGQRGKTVILEIDPPVDDVSIHRKGFYERAGFWVNSFNHVHPPYHEAHQGHRLVVMSCPEPLAEPEYDIFNLYLKNTVMGC